MILLVFLLGVAWNVLTLFWENWHIMVILLLKNHFLNSSFVFFSNHLILLSVFNLWFIPRFCLFSWYLICDLWSFLLSSYSFKNSFHILIKHRLGSIIVLATRDTKVNRADQQSLISSLCHGGEDRKSSRFIIAVC